MTRTPDRSTESEARRLAYAERGLHGVMRGTLILEAITALLAIPVAVKVDEAGWIGVLLTVLLTVLLIASCGIVSRRFALPVILGVQVAMIACWVIIPPLGIMGVVFGLVWLAILWFRREFRRRLAAGRLPGPQGHHA